MLETLLFRYGDVKANDDSDLPFPSGTPFKGVVSARNFITGDQLASTLGLQVGGSMNSDAGWLHFIEDNGYEIYVAKKPLRNKVTWQEIKSATAGKVVTIGGRNFTVELLTGALTDPTAVSNSAVGGEWNRYMYNVFKGEDYASIPGRLDWGSYTNAMLGIQTAAEGANVTGSGQFCEEAASGIADAYITRGRNGSSTTTPILAMWYGRPVDVAANQGHVYGWRPKLVLEGSKPEPEPTPFKGEVTGTDLITMANLKSLVQSTSGVTIRGTAINQSTTWLHYEYEGKTLYVSKMPIMHSVFSTDFINSGANDGRLIVAIGGKYYKVRWLTGTTSIQNEWNSLMYPIYGGADDVPNKGLWAHYTNAELGMVAGTTTNAMCFSQGTYSGNAGTLTRGGYAGGGVVGSWYQPANPTTSNAGYAWRPVLELTDYTPPVTADNGPGPSTMLVADPATGDGYYGLATTTEMFTMAEVEAQAITALPGTALNTGVQDLWGKYRCNDKILYIPRVTVRSGVSWANLYNAGFMYGTDDNGLYPYTTNASFDVIPLTPVNQLRLITKTDPQGNVWTFKIRTVRVMSSDPNANTTDTAAIRLSEYSRTVERTQPTDGMGVVWANNGKLVGAVCGVETRGTSGGLQVYQLIANGNGNAYYRGFSTKQAGVYWLPVLELVSVVKP